MGSLQEVFFFFFPSSFLFSLKDEAISTCESAVRNDWGRGKGENSCRRREKSQPLKKQLEVQEGL